MQIPRFGAVMTFDLNQKTLRDAAAQEVSSAGLSTEVGTPFQRPTLYTGEHATVIKGIQAAMKQQGVTDQTVFQVEA